MHTSVSGSSALHATNCHPGPRAGVQPRFSGRPGSGSGAGSGSRSGAGPGGSACSRPAAAVSGAKSGPRLGGRGDKKGARGAPVRLPSGALPGRPARRIQADTRCVNPVAPEPRSSPERGSARSRALQGGRPRQRSVRAAHAGRESRGDKGGSAPQRVTRDAGAVPFLRSPCCAPGSAAHRDAGDPMSMSGRAAAAASCGEPGRRCRDAPPACARRPRRPRARPASARPAQ